MPKVYYVEDSHGSKYVTVFAKGLEQNDADNFKEEVLRP